MTSGNSQFDGGRNGKSAGTTETDAVRAVERAKAELRALGRASRASPKRTLLISLAAAAIGATVVGSPLVRGAVKSLVWAGATIAAKRAAASMLSGRSGTKKGR